MIKDWGSNERIEVSIDNRSLSQENYKKVLLEDGDLLIWIEAMLSSENTIKIKKI